MTTGRPRKATQKKPVRKSRPAKKDRAIYPALSVFSTGLKGRCPRCGEGRLFRSYMKPVKSCAICGLDMRFAEEGDGPAVFAILILGFAIAGTALMMEYRFHPPIWVHIIVWIPVTIILGTWFLKILKGIMIAIQHKTGAGEGKLQD